MARPREPSILMAVEMTTTAGQGIDAAIDGGREILSRTGDRDAVLEFLSASGLEIVGAIKASRMIFSISLREAKEICVRSGLWSAQVAATEPLLDELERIFRDRPD